MVKSNELSSDVNIIKEFEELKLKQRLLIESLKNNTDSNQNKLFLEINSKLDFLVKIFTEANQTESEDEHKTENKYNEIINMISNLEEKFNTSFLNIEDKISNILEKKEESIDKKEEGKETNKEGQLKEEEKVFLSESLSKDVKSEEYDNLIKFNEDKEINEEQNKEKEVIEIKTENDGNSQDNSLPPMPDFAVKIDNLDKQKEKKRKWF